MIVSTRLKYALFTPLFILATLVLSFSNVQFASAATLTWDGSAGDSKFNTAANWNTDTVPTNGDVLNFDVSILSSSATLDNNISSLSVAGINFTGTNAGYYAYTITGNSLTVTGALNNTAVSGGESSFNSINTDLVLGANITANTVSIGSTGKILNLQTYNLAYTSASSCGSRVSSNISGSGAINVTGGLASFTGTNTDYAGTTTISAGTTVIRFTALGSAAGGTVVSGTGSLSINTDADISIAEPLTFSGSGQFGTQGSSSGFCSGTSVPKTTTTLTGGVTLLSNFELASRNDIVIPSNYTSNGHTFSVTAGSTGTLTTPEGQTDVPSETKDLSGDLPEQSEYLGNKQTGILNGARDSISVGDGGILKGTGTTNTLYVGDDGTVSPGNSPGTLTVLETFSTSGVYQAEVLNKDVYDQLRVGENYTGGFTAVTLNTGATLNLILYDGWAINQGEQFVIIDNRDASAVSGTFDGLAEGAQLTVDGIVFSITYVGGDGNDVVITALNTGTDPTPPNTGVAQIIMANPIVLTTLMVISAVLLVIVAIRRRQTN